MSETQTKGLGALSAMSIGIGAMIGGGLFAVTGLTIEVTHGAAPLAFVIAGIIALLTSYSYLKLSLRYPGNGGTVMFLNRGFGNGTLTGALNIVLSLSYVVMLAVNAYAFGSYGASFAAQENHALWRHGLSSAILLLLAGANWIGADLVIRSENLMNLVKILLLILFIGIGFAANEPFAWDRMSSNHYVSSLGLVSGAMIIFLNYEGFELIANVAEEVEDRRRSLPIAYFGAVLLVLVLYVLIVAVVLGHMSIAQVIPVSDHVLSNAAAVFMGRTGFVLVALTAMLATSSAINAIYYSSSRLIGSIAHDGQLPRRLERPFYGRPLRGMLWFTLLALALVNLAPLHAIAVMASTGFLLIFMAVNFAHVLLAAETGGARWISWIGTLACALALFIMLLEVDENPHSHYQVWIVLGFIISALTIEIVYRKLTGRSFISTRSRSRVHP